MTTAHTRRGRLRPAASTLLDGVFWSGELKRAAYERSREFVSRSGGARGRTPVRARGRHPRTRTGAPTGGPVGYPA
ncbi:hypothetical protein [Streptomyces zaomyceticus]|uniref:hypothetical protein n=1 Tax=Streptomyces zaomyceticus TaxID=68286 RepID=UPI0033A7DEBB